MKKTFTGIISFLAVMLTLTACGSGKAPAAVTEESTGETTSFTETETSAVSEDTTLPEDDAVPDTIKLYNADTDEACKKAYETLRAKNQEVEFAFLRASDAVAYRYDGISTVNGKDTYGFSFGTDYEDKFTVEYIFAVDINDNSEIYYFDIINNEYIPYEDADLYRGAGYYTDEETEAAE